MFAPRQTHRRGRELLEQPHQPTPRRPALLQLSSFLRQHAGRGGGDREQRLRRVFTDGRAAAFATTTTAQKSLRAQRVLHKRPRSEQIQDWRQSAGCWCAQSVACADGLRLRGQRVVGELVGAGEVDAHACLTARRKVWLLQTRHITEHQSEADDRRPSLIKDQHEIQATEEADAGSVATTGQRRQHGCRCVATEQDRMRRGVLRRPLPPAPSARTPASPPPPPASPAARAPPHGGR
eukprot:COSAG04_NODE_3059_length_3223_cov_4.698464_5_plen_237_part_00